MSTSRPIGRHALLLLAGVGITVSLAVALIGPALVAAATPKTVAMLASTYSPATFSVKAGTTVTFKNTSQLPHTATADNGSFDTGMVSPGASKSVVVKKAGQVTFHCQFHGAAGGVGQSGTITVTTAAGATARPTKPAVGGTAAQPPATDTRPALPGLFGDLTLAAFAGAGVITVLLALGLDGAGRARRRRSER